MLPRSIGVFSFRKIFTNSAIFIGLFFILQSVWADCLVTVVNANARKAGFTDTRYPSRTEAENAVNNSGVATSDFTITCTEDSSSQAQLEQNQFVNEARDLNQKGIEAFQNGVYDTAVAYFEQALDKTPNDASIQQNLQNAKDKVEARNKFKTEQNEALNDLKDTSGDSDSGLKGAGDSDSGLKDISSSEDSDFHRSTTKKSHHSKPSVNTDPNVVDLRGIKNLSIDPAKLKEMANTAAGKLVEDPVYKNVLNDGIAAYKSGSASDKHAAVEKLRNLNELIVLPEDKDMELLFDATDKVTFEQILNGVALPTNDDALNQILKDHPELKTQLIAMWYKTCRQRIKAEDAEMAISVKKLSVVVRHLGLVYGHIEEAIAKDPKLKAKWQAVILNAALNEGSDELNDGFQAFDHFNDQVRKLVNGIRQSSNPYELK